MKITESELKNIIKECVYRILNESNDFDYKDDFKPQGYYTDSNWGGKEIEISSSGDAARIRTNYGDGPSKPSEWCEIQYDYEDEDGNDISEDPRPYIFVNGDKEYLDHYMRY